MMKHYFLMLAMTFADTLAMGQDVAAYLHEHAVVVQDPNQLNDSVYQLLSPFKVVMMGEMHGTNEPAGLVIGLAKMFTNIGDSVQVGLEIPDELMADYLASHSDSSIYSSVFFSNPPFKDGRESGAWAGVIAALNDEPRVNVFFFDRNDGDGDINLRDSIMYLKIKKQYQQHPTWKLITLSGNWHNRVAEDKSMAVYLKKDQTLNLSSKLCTLNHYYLEGTCRADFGNGLEERQLGRPESVYDTSLDADKYLILVSAKSTYPYSGFYYTRFITPAKMTFEK